MHTNNQHIQNGLLVISGKEHGRLYVIHEGYIREFDEVIEHPPEYSDNEGFFISSGDGKRYGSGNPRETDDKANLDRYIGALKSELKEVVRVLDPAAIYVIEPLHLKDKITEHKVNFGDVPIHTVAYGNYVDSPKEELLQLINDYQKESHDPTDPASVAGEENASEKRKILEIAKLRN